MKALIVGGAGVTGRLLIAGLLERGYAVTMLSRGQRPVAVPDSVERLQADPYDKESVPAALEGRSFDLAIVTYGRLRHVAKALVGKTKRMISVGGAAPIYKGWGDMTAMNPWETTSATPLFLEEDHPLASAETETGFSLAVRFTEEQVMALHESGDLNITHYRYPTVFGPDNLCPAEWGLVRRAREQRKPLITPAGGLTIPCRGFCDNVAHGVLLSVDQPEASAGQIYNIRDEALLHNHEWISLVEDLLDFTFERVDIPFDCLPQGFRATPPQLLYRNHGILSIDKLQQQLGYRDIVSAEEALERTVKWYLDNPLEPGSVPEQNLGDPFDYAYEDAFIAAWRKRREQFLQDDAALEKAEVIWRHPYQ